VVAEVEEIHPIHQKEAVEELVVEEMVDQAHVVLPVQSTLAVVAVEVEMVAEDIQVVQVLLL
tara:strand:- start:21 stop:206 length:186 start_codon:yes stop_codon:yes gene_type:complete